MFNTKRNALFSVFQNLPFKFIQMWRWPKEEKKKNNSYFNFCHKTSVAFADRGRNMISVHPVFAGFIWIETKD